MLAICRRIEPRIIKYSKSVVFLSYFQYLTSRMHSKYVDYEQQGEAPPKPRVVSSILTAPAIETPQIHYLRRFILYVCY